MGDNPDPFEHGDEKGEPELMRFAPAVPRSAEPYMGLMEAIAFAGSGDERLAAAAYCYGHEYSRGDAGAAELWMLLGSALEAIGANISDAAASVIRACAAPQGIQAVGLLDGRDFETIPNTIWVGSRVAFEKEPDAIRPKDSRSLGSPRWSQIQLPRQAVVERWPSSEKPLTAPPKPMAKRGRGRPPTWDWDAAMAALFDADSLNDIIAPVIAGTAKQAELETFVLQWFSDRHKGEHPEESSVRKRIAKVLQARREWNREQGA